MCSRHWRLRRRSLLCIFRKLEDRHRTVSAVSVSREQPEEELVEELADRFADVRVEIANDLVPPRLPSPGKIATFSPYTQLARVYRLHRDIQRGDIAAPGESFRSVMGDTWKILLAYQ